MLSLTPSLMMMKELGRSRASRPCREHRGLIGLLPHCRWPTCCCSHRREIHRLGIDEFHALEALLVLMPKLVNSRYESAPVLRVALSW